MHLNFNYYDNIEIILCYNQCSAKIDYLKMISPHGQCFNELQWIMLFMYLPKSPPMIFIPNG